METSFEEHVAGLIAKDAELTRILKGKIKEALEKLDLTEIIGSQLAETVECVFEDLDLSEVITTPVGQAISAYLNKALGVKPATKQGVNK